MSEKTILIVEDDKDLREALLDTLTLEGFYCLSAKNAREAMTKIKKDPDLVLTDVQMEGKSGLALLTDINKITPHIPVILMTAFGNVADAITAIRNGAVDYLVKPFEPEALLKVIQKVLPNMDENTDGPIAEDPQSKRLLSLAMRVAQTDATVMISGESGTGKEVLANFIHDHSAREKKPFVAINCAAIPENMLEASLFGYEKGAFTGAYKATPGKFELAQDGTLLLDEISEMDLSLQAKLLRVLQEREVERIGSNQLIPLNVRVIATTNRDMNEEVKAGRFREDLYYRLNVFPLHWIPLRQRKMDIMPMANYLIKKHSESQGCPMVQLSKAAQKILLDHRWPGNAREMDNVVQRALILQQGNEISGDDLCLANTLQDSRVSTEIEE
jgi:two-component system, response regulator FlrC